MDMDNTNNSLIYQYIRGSHLYGTNIETSDEDTGGVYIANLDDVFGIGFSFEEMQQNDTHDHVNYELAKYLRSLAKGNPNIVESLFVPDDLILYKHPIMDDIISQRNNFLTKKFVNAAAGMAISQIRKARGLKKKIVNPVYERKGVLDFCYTTYNQGSTNIKNWLAYRYLFQEYCGCVNIPNMRDTVGVYYDWKRFFTDYNYHDLYIKSKLYDRKTYGEHADIVRAMKALYNDTMPGPDYIWGTDIDSVTDEEKQRILKLRELSQQLYYCRIDGLLYFIYQQYITNSSYTNIEEWVQEQLSKNYDSYSGMVNKEETSNELRLSSVSKGEKPICIITFNKDDYSQHCREYKEYKEWEEKRNPARYESNLNKNYDSKNLMHAFRLLAMSIELAETGEVHIDRRNIDREFLLDVRNHKYEYDELMDKLEALKIRLDKALETTTLPDDIDTTFLNELCVAIRYKFYNVNRVK